MKRKIMLLFALALLTVCSPGAYAAHVHNWEASYDYVKYNSSSHKRSYFCYGCQQKKYEIEPHRWSWVRREKYTLTQHMTVYRCDDCGEEKRVAENHKLYPDGGKPRYEYGDANTCYYVTFCTICDETIKKPLKHKWYGHSYSYRRLNDATYHIKYDDANCAQCAHHKEDAIKEPHNYGFHWRIGMTSIYYGCDKCSYGYDNKYKSNTVIRSEIKKGKAKTYTVKLLLKDDKIKSVKVNSGKKKVKVKKKSNTKLYVKGKKKGKAKITVTTRSGVTYTYLIKVK